MKIKRTDNIRPFKKSKKHGYQYAWWFDEVYRENFYLVIDAGKSLERFPYFMKSQFGLDYTLPEIRPAALVDVLQNENGASAIVIAMASKFDWSPYDISVITHECVHACEDVFNTRHISWDKDYNAANEPYAYYIQYLVRQCLDLIKDRDRRIKR